MQVPVEFWSGPMHSLAGAVKSVDGLPVRHLAGHPDWGWHESQLTRAAHLLTVLEGGIVQQVDGSAVWWPFECAAARDVPSMLWVWYRNAPRYAVVVGVWTRSERQTEWSLSHRVVLAEDQLHSLALVRWVDATPEASRAVEPVHVWAQRERAQVEE